MRKNNITIHSNTFSRSTTTHCKLEREDSYIFEKVVELLTGSGESEDLFRRIFTILLTFSGKSTSWRGEWRHSSSGQVMRHLLAGHQVGTPLSWMAQQKGEARISVQDQWKCSFSVWELAVLMMLFLFRFLVKFDNNKEINIMCLFLYYT